MSKKRNNGAPSKDTDERTVTTAESIDTGADMSGPFVAVDSADAPSAPSSPSFSLSRRFGEAASAELRKILARLDIAGCDRDSLVIRPGVSVTTPIGGKLMPGAYLDAKTFGEGVEEAIDRFREKGYLVPAHEFIANFKG